MPWKAYGELRGLKAPPRRKVAPASFTCCAVRKDLLAALDRAWAGHDGNLIATDFDSMIELDDGAFGPKGAACELVRRTDPVNREYPRKQLVLVDVHGERWTYAGQDGLGCAGCPVHIDASFDHPFDDGVYLFFRCVFLHCYDHCLFPVSGDCTPASWLGIAAWAFP
jgi:hypothetical protein